MLWRIYLFGAVAVIYSSVSCEQIRNKMNKFSDKYTQGLEFDQISRSSLLKLLAAMEENINMRALGKHKPVFTAHFVNNKFSKPYIYPEISTILKTP